MTRSITFILSIIWLIFGSVEAQANLVPNLPKKVVTHGDYFPLNRSIYVNVNRLPEETADEFVKLLKNSGAKVETSFFKQFFTPKIVFKQTNNLDFEGDEKVKITVSYKRVLIEFNTPKAALRGMDMLLDILKKRNNNYVIDGVNIIDWATKRDRVAKTKHNGFDLTDPAVNMQFILNTINKSAQGGTLFLYGSTPQEWAVESQVLYDANPKWLSYIAKPNYTINEIKQIIDAGKARKINVILNINLIEENEFLKNVIGHSIYSVEGMRFVRAIIEEYKNRLNVTQIAIGYIPAGIDTFYLEFLERVKELNGIEIIFE